MRAEDELRLELEEFRRELDRDARAFYADMRAVVLSVPIHEVNLNGIVEVGDRIVGKSSDANPRVESSIATIRQIVSYCQALTPYLFELLGNPQIAGETQVAAIELLGVLYSRTRDGRCNSVLAAIIAYPESGVPVRHAAQLAIHLINGELDQYVRIASNTTARVS